MQQVQRTQQEMQRSQVEMQQSQVEMQQSQQDMQQSQEEMQQSQQEMLRSQQDFKDGLIALQQSLRRTVTEVRVQLCAVDRSAASKQLACASRHLRLHVNV